jgi:hypothetical protein
LGWIQMLWKGTVPVIIVAPVVLVTLSKNPMMNHYMKEERRRLWLRYALLYEHSSSLCICMGAYFSFIVHFLYSCTSLYFLDRGEGKIKREYLSFFMWNLLHTSMYTIKVYEKRSKVGTHMNADDFQITPFTSLK